MCRARSGGGHPPARGTRTGLGGGRHAEAQHLGLVRTEFAGDGADHGALTRGTGHGGRRPGSGPADARLVVGLREGRDPGGKGQLHGGVLRRDVAVVAHGDVEIGGLASRVHREAVVRSGRRDLRARHRLGRGSDPGSVVAGRGVRLRLGRWFGGRRGGPGLDRRARVRRRRWGQWRWGQRRQRRPVGIRPRFRGGQRRQRRLAGRPLRGRRRRDGRGHRGLSRLLRLAAVSHGGAAHTARGQRDGHGGGECDSRHGDAEELPRPRLHRARTHRGRGAGRRRGGSGPAAREVAEGGAAEHEERHHTAQGGVDVGEFVGQRPAAGTVVEVLFHLSAFPQREPVAGPRAELARRRPAPGRRRLRQVGLEVLLPQPRAGAVGQRRHGVR